MMCFGAKRVPNFAITLGLLVRLKPSSAVLRSFQKIVISLSSFIILTTLKITIIASFYYYPLNMISNPYMIVCDWLYYFVHIFIILVDGKQSYHLRSRNRIHENGLCRREFSQSLLRKFSRATYASFRGIFGRGCSIKSSKFFIKEVMIGNEASKYRSLLELSYPTSEGIVKNWEDMELLLKYSFGQVPLK